MAILAGGKSRRMGGHDKAAITVDHVSMLQRVTSAALEAGYPVCIIGRSPHQLPPDTSKQVRAQPDEHAGRGPIGGLHAALKLAPPHHWVLLCPCDVPHIQPRHFRWLAAHVAHCDSNPLDGIIPTRGGQLEPLFALYNISLLPLVENQIAAGDFALKNLIAQGNFRITDLPDDQLEASADVDTIDDLRKLIGDLPTPKG